VVVVALSIALLVGGLSIVAVAQMNEDPDQEPQEATYLRVAHASPDAPAVNVTMDNETVLSNVSFGTVSDYMALQAGTHNLTIAAADDPDTVVFDGNVTLDPGSAWTLAATGEVGDDAESSFEPVLFEDDALMPTENRSALNVVHLVPDAPAVDVTASNGSVLLAENVTFRNGTHYVTVEPGNYTAEIRPATANNTGEVLATVNVSLENGTAYSAMAVGYLKANQAPADTPFQVVLSEDATRTIHLPSQENRTATGTPTPTPTETATPTPTATES
jgi:hypothetical protein